MVEKGGFPAHTEAERLQKSLSGKHNVLKRFVHSAIAVLWLSPIIHCLDCYIQTKRDICLSDPFHFPKKRL